MRPKIAERGSTKDGNSEVYLHCNVSPYPNDDTFSFQPVINVMVIVVVSLIRNTGPGHNEFPMFVFKEIVNKLANIITKTYNESLNSGVFYRNLHL